MQRASSRLLRPVLLLLALAYTAAPVSTARSQADPEPCNGPKAEVNGVITGPSGSPVNGAIIKYYGVHWNPDCRSGVYESSETRSDSSGTYRIEVPVGKGRALSVERTDAAGFPMEIIALAEVVPEGIRADHQFKLFRIQGRVVDASGIPIRDGVVTYYLKPSSPICGTGLPEGQIREGRFESVVYASGTYVFWVRPGMGGLGVPSHPGTIAISSDTTVAITADAYRVEGVVVGDDGKPLDGVVVVAQGQVAGHDRSDGDGRYSLILPEGRYRLATIYPVRQVQPCEPESLTVSGPARVRIRMKGTPIVPNDNSKRIRR
jgi:hypothetical protein